MPTVRHSHPRARRRKVVLAGFVAVLACALSVVLSRVTENAGLALLDTQMRFVAAHFPRIAKREVVVVGIDEATRRSVTEPLALWHAHFGRLLQALSVGKPAVIGLDVLFPERSYDHLVAGQDMQLLRGVVAVRGASHVVVGRGIDEQGMPRDILPAVASLLGADSIAYIALPVDADGVIRRFREDLGQGGEAVVTLAGAMARKIGVQPSAGIIDYAIGPLVPPLSMKTVLEWRAAGDLAALQRAFAGKLVLVGDLSRFDDRFTQPVNLASWESGNGNRVPGVLIHAQIVRSLVDRGPIKVASPVAVAAATLLVSLLWFIPMHGWMVVAAATGFLSLLFLGCTALLAGGMHLDAFNPLLIGAIAIIGRWMVEAGLHLGERLALRRTFSGYVGPQLLREILAGRVHSGLGGELRTVAILFADMRGFTTTSAAMAPAEVIELLNRYFERAAAAIHAEGGMLNSIMGDGLMAIFGAPKAMANPSVAAFAAARRMLDMLPALNAELAAEGRPQIAIGIGINVGEAVVGHVGSRARHEYSAIGDTTNTAARLEQLTKELGVPLVCSRAVAEAVGFPSGLTSLGEQSIRGRANMEVFGWRQPLPDR